MVLMLSMEPMWSHLKCVDNMWLQLTGPPPVPSGTWYLLGKNVLAACGPGS